MKLPAKLLAVAGIAALAMALPIRAGIVDTSFQFGGSGFLDASLRRGVDTVRVVRVAPDDSIVVAGSFSFVNGTTLRRIARLLPDGTPDPRFQSPFTVEAPGPIYGMDLDAAGRIYIGGNIGAPFVQPNPCILRLKPDGRMDYTFGTGVPLPRFPNTLGVDAAGRVYYAAGTGASDGRDVYRLKSNGNVDAPLEDVSTIGNVGILARGKSAYVWGFAGLSRWNDAGSFDTTFHPAPDFTFYALASDAAGNLIGSVPVAALYPRGLARFDASGNLDPSFVPDQTPGSPVLRLVALPDGSVVGQGEFKKVGSIPRAGLARFLRDGTLDSAFDPGTGANGAITALGVQSTGLILVGGQFGSWNGIPAPGLVRLLPADQPDRGIVEFDSAQLAFTENGGHMSVNLHRTAGSGGTVSVLVVPRLALANDPLNALDGVHYLFPDTRVVFADGQTNASVDVDIRGDTVVNPDRSFELLLRDPLGGARIGPTGTVRVTIVNEDYTVTLGSAAIDAHEVEGRVGIPLHRVGATGEAFSVGLELVAGSAVEGLDYRLPTAPFQFAADATDVTAWIEIPDNQKPDPPRTFEVRLVNPTARATIAGIARATVTIRDNDHPGGLVPNTRIFAGTTNRVLWNRGQFKADGGSVVWSESEFSQSILSFGSDGTLVGNTPIGTRYTTALFLGQNNDVFGATTVLIVWIRTDLGFPDPGTSFVYKRNGADSPPLLVVPSRSGKAYAAADAVLAGQSTRHHLARLLHSGLIDSSFDAAIDGGGVLDLFEADDGTLLVGGTFNSTSGIPREGLARLYPDGSVDPNYARRLPGTLPATIGVAALAPLADGSMYVGGSFLAFGGESRPGIVRVDPNGDVDEGFASVGNGFTYQGGPPAVRQLAVQSDGKILVLGTFDAYGGRPISSELVRLRPDGTIDETFAAGSIPGIARMRIFGDGTVGIMGALPSIDGAAGAGPARLWLGPDEFPAPRFARVAAVAPDGTHFELDRGISGNFALETSADLRTWNDSGRRIVMPSGWRFDDAVGDAARFYRLRRIQ